MKGMAADFQSLRAISGMVNTILGIITLLLAYRTKNNSWSELLAAKLLGCFLLFHGILMTTAYIAGFFTVGSFGQSFFGSLVDIAHTISIGMACSACLFFPYPFVQRKHAEQAVAVVVLIWSFIVTGLIIFIPYETHVVRYAFWFFPTVVWGFVYVRFSVKELVHKHEHARGLSAASGLLILATMAWLFSDWLLWITVMEKFTIPGWVSNIPPDKNPMLFFVRQSLIMGVSIAALLTMFVLEGWRVVRHGFSVLSGIVFGFFFIGIISFIVDLSVVDVLEDCIYATCQELPESWTIYNTFTNILTAFLIQPIVLMYLMLNFNLLDVKTGKNGRYAKAMVLVLVVIVSSTIIEMLQSIIPIGELLTSAFLAIGIAAAIGWEHQIMEQFLKNKNRTVDYLKTIGEIRPVEPATDATPSLNFSLIVLFVFAILLSVLHGAIGLG